MRREGDILLPRPRNTCNESFERATAATPSPRLELNTLWPPITFPDRSSARRTWSICCGIGRRTRARPRLHLSGRRRERRGPRSPIASSTARPAPSPPAASDGHERRAGPACCIRPGLDFVAAFFGCLYAGVMAVPAYPPRRNRNDGAHRGDRRRRRAKIALDHHARCTSACRRARPIARPEEHALAGDRPVDEGRRSRTGGSPTCTATRWRSCNTPPARPARPRA